MRKLLDFELASALCGLLLLACAAAAHGHERHEIAPAEAAAISGHTAHAHHAQQTGRVSATSPDSCPGDGGSACCFVRHWSSGTPQPRIGPCSTATLALPAVSIAYVAEAATAPTVLWRHYLVCSGSPRAPPIVI